MKFSFAAVASLLLSVAYSQTIASEVAQIPSCALTCLTTAITGAGCGLSDYACQCGTAKNSITTSATPCVLSACSTTDALKLQSVVGEICTIQAASGGGGGGSSSAAAGTTTAAPPTTTTAATPATSNVSNISNIGSLVTTATSAGVTTTAASSSTSAPAQVSASPGNRLQAGGVIAGAAALLAFVF